MTEPTPYADLARAEPMPMDDALYVAIQDGLLGAGFWEQVPMDHYSNPDDLLDHYVVSIWRKVKSLLNEDVKVRRDG